MGMVIVIIAFVLSIIVTSFILKIINKNTFGTQSAYVKRTLTIWFICFMIIAAILGNFIA